MGASVTLVDSAATTAEAVSAPSRRERPRVCGARHRCRSHVFLATDAPERFARIGEIFLGRAIAPETVELVDLQEG